MDVDAYLSRIGYTGPRAPTLANLRAIHLAHMHSVPFENIDIYFKRRTVELDTNAMFAKVVGERRGGFCYELNGLFAALLRELGFDVTYLSGRTVDKGRERPEFDHLLLLVDVEGRRIIADVGFGDSSRLPMDLDEPGPQGDPPGAWRLAHDDDGDWTLLSNANAGKWNPVYRFSTHPRQLSDFAEMCAWHQASSESHFTQGHVCSVATPDGRVTVTGNRLIELRDGKRTITKVSDDATWRQILKDTFGVVLPELAPARA
ncbi:MAG: arylamine N-acetyltransferase family protein [Dehalococcoidia bacterium]